MVLKTRREDYSFDHVGAAERTKDYLFLAACNPKPKASNAGENKRHTFRIWTGDGKCLTHSAADFR